MENGEKGQMPSLDDVMHAVLPEDMPMHPDHPMQQAAEPEDRSSRLRPGYLAQDVLDRAKADGERSLADRQQDERNPTSADYLAARSALESCDWSNVPLGTKAILGRAVDLLWLAAHATRPAQTEQQPSDWKLVPVELTQEMSDAGRNLLAQGSVPMSKVYRAILDAAPIAQTVPRPTGLSQGWNLVRQCDGFVIGHSSEEPSQRHKEQALADGRIYVPFLVAQTALQHSDDAAVDRFAAAMKAKLAKSRAKGRVGWDDPNVCSVEFLAQLLVEHLGKGNTGTFEDVANFAMMLHQRSADPKVLAEAAAPQPEQSGLADLPYQTLFNAIAAATDAGDSPVSISVKAFRAALSAQGGEA